MDNNLQIIEIILYLILFYFLLQKRKRNSFIRLIIMFLIGSWIIKFIMRHLVDANMNVNLNERFVKQPINFDDPVELRKRPTNKKLKIKRGYCYDKELEYINLNGEAYGANLIKMYSSEINARDYHGKYSDGLIDNKIQYNKIYNKNKARNELPENMFRPLGLIET